MQKAAPFRGGFLLEVQKIDGCVFVSVILELGCSSSWLGKIHLNLSPNDTLSKSVSFMFSFMSFAFITCPSYVGLNASRLAFISSGVICFS